MGSIVYRWDLDKTYLVSDFESLRSLLRVPFERAEDKVAVPGVIPLIRGLRRTAEASGHRPYVYFLTSSPPQIGSVIKEKLALDGIGYDGITFKDQMYHIVRGRFDALREQIGYKLAQLLQGAAKIEPGSREILFGDDWESDPFVYSLYADIVAGRVDVEQTLVLLDAARVSGVYIRQITELMRSPLPGIEVASIFVLRQRRTPDAELAVFRRRLAWFDNYFECSLVLHHAGLLDLDGVIDVVRDIGLEPRAVAGSFEAVVARGRVPRAALGKVRRHLLEAGLSTPVPRAKAPALLAFAVRRRLRRPSPGAGSAEPLPDYASLVRDWSHHGRRSRRAHDEAEPARPSGRSADAAPKAGDPEEEAVDGG